MTSPPQVTNEPSTRIAVNALSVVDIETTSVVPLSAVDTELESPPYAATPQVTTEPSDKIAANAASVAYIELTVKLLLPPLKSTVELLPPPAASPHVTTDPSLLSAANAYRVA